MLTSSDARGAGFGGTRRDAAWHGAGHALRAFRHRRVAGGSSLPRRRAGGADGSARRGACVVFERWLVFQGRSPTNARSCTPLSAAIISAAFSPIMIDGAFVLPLVTLGMTLASATRNFPTPRARS